MFKKQNPKYVENHDIYKVNHCIRVIKEYGISATNMNIPNSAHMMLRMSDWEKEKPIISGKKTPMTGIFLGSLWFYSFLLDKWDKDASK